MTRPVAVLPPPGAEYLRFHKMEGQEELGRLFRFEVELFSTEPEVELGTLIGKSMAVRLELPDGGERFFHGLITDFHQVSDSGRYAVYHASLRPSMWTLQLRTTCRIFQHMSVPDIAKAVLREHGVSDFRENLSGSYPSQEFTVQYRESDFDFISRLMEREGIYYCFEHHADRHTLVFADNYSAHEPMPGYESIPYYPEQQGGRRERDHIDSWRIAQKKTTGAVMLDDYDFTRPRANLSAKLMSSDASDAALEVYDYPGRYDDTSQGETYARVRLEQHNARQHLAHGEGDVRGMCPGSLFSLTNHPRQDQNREYLIVAARYELESLNYESKIPGASSPTGRVCHFRMQVMPSAVPYRSATRTPTPKIRGPQTAVVVGKAGEEIWTDEYGRVKLQFRWDREGGSDENSSCWVRVAQLWSGGGWGGTHVPRIGQEVVVEFLEGDPDRPIVTGRVYNADNMPPYALPDHQTQSGIKTRSSPDGTPDNFNELRFEDKKGSEQVYLQAEKDFVTYVKNDEAVTIGHDRHEQVLNDETVVVQGHREHTVVKNETVTIDGSRKEVVTGDESITIHGARSEQVDGSETVSIGGSRTTEVGGDENNTVHGGRQHQVDGSQGVTIGGSETWTVGGDLSVTLGGKHTSNVGADETVTVGGARMLTVTGPGTLTLGGARSATVGGDDRLEVGGSRTETIGGPAMMTAATLVFDGQGGIELVSGGSSIKITPGGIMLSGPQVKVAGEGVVNVTAGGVLSLSGALIKHG